MIAFMCRKPATVLLVILGCLFTSLSSHAQILNESDKLIGSDTSIDTNFGGSMAVSGDTMVIGSYGSSNTRGSAYVYRFDGGTWVEEQKLIASDSDSQDSFSFGISVAVSDETIVVGGFNDVWVFRFDGSSWNQEQILTPSDEQFFGRTVALSGDTIVITGTTRVDVTRTIGTVYVYRFDGSTWNQQQRLTADDAERDSFGNDSLAISGDTLVIGNRIEDDFTGVVYVYRFDGNSWIEEQKLTASDVVPQDRFGFALSVTGDTVAIGTYPAGSSTRRGSVYVYRFDGNSWIEEQKLTSIDTEPMPNDFALITSVAISEDTVVFNIIGDGRRTGAAYMYRFDGSTWGQKRELVSSDLALGDNFGAAVAAHTDTVLVGAPTDDDIADSSGSVYVFSLDNNTAPTITSTATRTVPENQTSAVDVNANDDMDSEGAGLTYSISDGADQSLFEIDAFSGVVTFISAPDFEIPGDAGGDNVYNIAVTVTDSRGLIDTQAIAITVENEDEPPVAKPDVECEYIIKADWKRGYIAMIRLTNKGDSPVTSGWTVSWSYTEGTKVARLWNADWHGNNPYTASAKRWNSTIQPGHFVQFGMLNWKPSRNAPAEAPQVTGDICN